MKKLYTIFLTLLLSGTAQATHFQGGEITWESLGNNQYIIQLTLYRQCWNVSLGNSHVIQGPNGSITVSLQGSSPLFPSCYDPASSLQCQTTTPPALEKIVYESNPVTLAPSIPASGYVFSFTFCCRPSSTLNILSSGNSWFKVESVMYEPNVQSPHFLEDHDPYLFGSQAVSLMSATDNPADSLHYEFYTPQTNGGPVSFVSGYSQNSPLPGPAIHSANQPVSLNSKTGLLKYGINSPATGEFMVGVKVECWKNGVLSSMVQREASYLNAINSGGAPPSIVIDTAQYPQVVRSGNSYLINAMVGDSIGFVLSATDMNSNAPGVPQVISLDPAGMALNSTWGLNNFNQPAQISPVSPQSSFSSPVTSNILFTWKTAAEHLHGNKKSYFFNFQFRDDACSIPRRKNLQLEVRIRNKTNIAVDSVTTCAGDTVHLKGYTYSGRAAWSPAAKVLNDSALTTLAVADTSRFYYLDDPQNPGLKDSIYVDVEQRETFTLGFNSGTLRLTDSANTTNRQWFYSGIPFYYPFDTLYPFGPGDYWVTARSRSCLYQSDTVNVLPGSFSVVQPGNGTINVASAPAVQSYGVSFEMAGSGTMSQVNIPGVYDFFGKTGGYSLSLKIYDQNLQEIYSKDVTLPRPFDGVAEVPVNFSFSPATEYTLAITGDTAYLFSFLSNVSVPYTPWNNGLSILDYGTGAAGSFPSNPSTEFIPFTMEVDNWVGINEAALLGTQLYPNPADDQIFVRNIEAGDVIVMMQADGRIVQQFTAVENSVELTCTRMPRGLYLLKIRRGSSEENHKIILD